MPSRCSSRSGEENGRSVAAVRRTANWLSLSFACHSASVRSKPGSAAYGASKSYLNALGEALHSELASTGVVVTTVLPLRPLPAR